MLLGGSCLEKTIVTYWWEQCSTRRTSTIDEASQIQCIMAGRSVVSAWLGYELLIEHPKPLVAYKAKCFGC